MTDASSQLSATSAPPCRVPSRLFVIRENVVAPGQPPYRNRKVLRGPGPRTDPSPARRTRASLTSSYM